MSEQHETAIKDNAPFTFYVNSKTGECKPLGSAFYRYPNPLYGTPEAIDWVCDMFMHTVHMDRYNQAAKVLVSLGYHCGKDGEWTKP